MKKLQQVKVNSTNSYSFYFDHGPLRSLCSDTCKKGEGKQNMNLEEQRRNMTFLTLLTLNVEVVKIVKCKLNIKCNIMN